MRQYYISDDSGNIRFTTSGLTALTRLFATHGIDISKIRTRRQYVKARLKVRPFILLEKWLRETPDESIATPVQTSQQHHLLMDSIFGNHSPDEYQRMISDYQKRLFFRVIDGGR